MNRFEYWLRWLVGFTVLLVGVCYVLVGLNHDSVDAFLGLLMIVGGGLLWTSTES